jgi:hypothetical protein
MDIFELPDGRVATTGSFSVAEWDEYVASLPKPTRATVVAPLGAVSEPPPEDDTGASADTKSSSAKGGKS